MSRNACTVRTVRFELSSLLRRTALVAASFAFALPGSAAAQYAIPEPGSDLPFFSLDSPIGAIEYVSARGLRVGDTGLTLGGFASLELDRQEGGPALFEIDGVNFLVLYEPFDFLRGFAEIELGRLLSVQTDRDGVRSDPDAEIERLYGDLSPNDAMNLRIGKFLTPVGRWNLVPAEPFVWTANEPEIVETAFDEHQTGGAFFGSVYPGSHNVSYWLYGQFMDPLDPSDDPLPSHRSLGGRLEFGDALGNWSIGASVLASEKNDDWSYLGGLDALLQLGPVELMSEFDIREDTRPKDDSEDLWGVYLQGVVDVGRLVSPLRGLYAVGRYEHYDANDPLEDADLWDVGLTWLPVPWVNIKATYRFTDHPTEDVRRGLSASFSIVF